jgi:hypothetical protein
MAKRKPMEPELPLGGGPAWPDTAEAKAVDVVAAWRRAHGMRYMSPIALRDLARRIARALDDKGDQKNDR